MEMLKTQLFSYISTFWSSWFVSWKRKKKNSFFIAYIGLIVKKIIADVHKKKKRKIFRYALMPRENKWKRSKMKRNLLLLSLLLLLEIFIFRFSFFSYYFMLGSLFGGTEHHVHINRWNNHCEWNFLSNCLCMCV